ncbi:MAG: hypothetical protein JXR48_04740 [Candidatus Delongbacteria bacterium]|nr:hypothetical protein [Candidatus Delongbacteria bacterium]MBN2834255.1 hypothetical protein [Candidatus Delongbacteria bacterium]
MTDYFTDDEHFYGRHYKFWHQLADKNIANLWKKIAPAKTLSIWGACDFVTTEQDHILLTDIVNSATPNSAEFMKIDNIDHYFRLVDSQKSSISNNINGDYNEQLAIKVLQWMNDLR